MSTKELAFKIEDLQAIAEKANALQLALEQAIFEGNFSPTEYRWGFVLLGDLTSNLKNQLLAAYEEMLRLGKGEENGRFD